MNTTKKLRVAASSGISSHAAGVFYAVSSLCKELLNRSVEIHVLGASKGFTAADRKMWGNVTVIPYKSYGPFSFSLGLRRSLESYDPQLLHQHGLWLDNQWASLQWQEKTGLPVVLSPHGMLDPWALQHSAWKKKLVGRLFADKSLRKATCIHALCQSEAESIRAYGLKNPIAVIPNGVELPDLSPQKGTKQHEKKRLLFLGRIHPKKGLKELLQAWAKARSLKPDGFSDWQLIIAGWDDGGHERGLKDLVASSGIADSVEFIGPKYGEEKDTLLRSVDAFILPSFSEGLPMSVLEAWSYQLPVLMTDFCNLSVGFESNAAIQVHPDAESIGQGLNTLGAMHEEERLSMGARGRTLVEAAFTWPKIANEMKAVYEWCLTGENPPESMEFYGTDD